MAISIVGGRETHQAAIADPIAHWTAGILRISGSAYGIRALAGFPTEEARDAAYAALPKYVSAKATLLYHGTRAADGTYLPPTPIITCDVSLRPDGANGGVNETGIRRLRTLVARYPGEIEYVLEYSNSIPVDEFLELAGLPALAEAAL